MDFLAALLRSGGIEALARQSGLKSKVAIGAAEGLLPVLVDGMRRYVRDNGGGRAGSARLIDLLMEHGDGALAAQIMGPSAVSPMMGEDLLDRFFPDQSAEKLVAGIRGAKPEVLEKLLPLLVMLLGGYISARYVATGDPTDLGEFTDVFANGEPDPGTDMLAP